MAFCVFQEEQLFDVVIPSCKKDYPQLQGCIQSLLDCVPQVYFLR